MEKTLSLAQAEHSSWHPQPDDDFFPSDVDNLGYDLSNRYFMILENKNILDYIISEQNSKNNLQWQGIWD